MSDRVLTHACARHLEPLRRHDNARLGRYRRRMAAIALAICMTKSLIDECLRPELALMARARGHFETLHVVWIGCAGRTGTQEKFFWSRIGCWSPETVKIFVDSEGQVGIAPIPQ